MGTLFMVNPPKRKRRTAAQRRATAKMIAANKRRKKAAKSATRKRAKSRRRTAPVSTTRRKRKGSATMARRKRSSTKRRTARRASTRRRRSSGGAKKVIRLRRYSGYIGNPRRRRRVRRYRRNPALFATLRQGAMDAGATLVGGAVARVVNGFVPLPKDGLAGVASGLAVALGVGFAARKVVRGDTARFITAGAMQVPIKSLITTFVPQAGAYLGDYDNVGAYALPDAGVSSYLTPGMYDGAGVGSYEGDMVYE